ncbi:MAG: hypothetical protein NTW16_16100 [Bacteroidetes bacterium]|nr:hypothetical protein [Bacteroidota bacterium]
MKTTTTILAIIFTLQIGVLFAGNEIVTTPATEAASSLNILSLAPSSPVEATFEDIVVDNTFFGLSPITPTVASFEDFSTELISVKDISPIIPSVADFSDAIDQVTFDPGQLSPVTPFEADFE